jgi:hypothetical protein
MRADGSEAGRRAFGYVGSRRIGQGRRMGLCASRGIRRDRGHKVVNKTFDQPQVCPRTKGTITPSF